MGFQISIKEKNKIHLDRFKSLSRFLHERRLFLFIVILSIILSTLNSVPRLLY